MKLIPIYTSQGDLGAFLSYPYIFNLQGEWIGFVEPDRKVYSVYGHYVGELSAEPRILRVREWSTERPRQDPPPEPQSIRTPAHVPLAPQMREVPVNMIDILEEAPDMLPPLGFGDLLEDLD